jgi:hypothetical protein
MPNKKAFKPNVPEWGMKTQPPELLLLCKRALAKMVVEESVNID